MANALLTPVSYAPARSKLAGSDYDSGNCFTPQFTLGFQPSKKVAGGFLLSGVNKFSTKYICFSAVDGIESVNSSSRDSEQIKAVPMPIVHIIQDADSDATVVEVSFGDRLGALLDTMKSLKELGLDVAKGSVITENSVIQTKFYITLSSSGRKVEDPDLLEKIRLSIITNLLKYHPESSERLAMGETFGVKAPPEKLNVELATRVKVKDDGPSRSLLYVETADRPGLMLDLIKTITDINIDVESAEIDTEGLMAKDKFYVSYRGKALNASLSQVLTNCLRYYLKRPGTIEDSY